MYKSQHTILTLFLNTASAQGQIALLDATQILAQAACTPKTDEKELIDSIESVLKTSNITYKDLTNAACITGPGGFTSLRTGSAAINTLYATLNIPIAGLHEALLYKARATVDDFLWLHSTKKDLVFIQGFGSYGKQFSEPVCVSIEDVELYCKRATITGELVAEHTERLHIQTEQWAELKAVEDVLPKLLSALEYKQEIVLPWYGRGW